MVARHKDSMVLLNWGGMARLRQDMVSNTVDLVNSRANMVSPLQVKVDTTNKAVMASSREDMVSNKEDTEGHHQDSQYRADTHLSNLRPMGLRRLHGTEKH